MTDYTRNKHVITNTATGESKDWGSINKAKKESRRLQQSGNTLSVIK